MRPWSWQGSENRYLNMAENLRQVQASLDHIIPALESLEENGPPS